MSTSNWGIISTLVLKFSKNVPALFVTSYLDFCHLAGKSAGFTKIDLPDFIPLLNPEMNFKLI